MNCLLLVQSYDKINLYQVLRQLNFILLIYLRLFGVGLGCSVNSLRFARKLIKFNAAKKITISFLKTKVQKYTVIRSPHIYKNSREVFGIRYYKAIISLDFFKDYINDLDVQDLLKFLVANIVFFLPSAFGLKIFQRKKVYVKV